MRLKLLNFLEIVRNKRVDRSNSLYKASSILDYLMNKFGKSGKIESNNLKLKPLSNLIKKDNKDYIKDLAKLIQEEDKFIK